MFRYTLPRLVPAIFPQLVCRIPQQNKAVFLTFDDGPVPGATEEVLAILKEYQAKATFFCVGDNIRKHSAIFQQVLQAGHRVGNHTYHHLKGWNYSSQEYLQNIELCRREIIAQGVSDLDLFRPPYGKLTLSQMKELSSYRIIMWDILARDFDHHVSNQKSIAKLKKHTCNGSIIIFHDSIKTIAKVSRTLPLYLDFCKAEGYSFAKL